jgi:RecJ-like exonuclease
MKCKACNGTGKEICENPDHWITDSFGGDVGRLGCPLCGHSVDRSIPNTVCRECKGTGKIDIKSET